MKVEVTPLAPPWSDLELKPSLVRHLELSTMSWIGRVNGKIVCTWGLIPPSYLSDEAYLWLNVTDKVAEHQFLFVRYSQMEMERMLELYPRIVGHAEVSNWRARRWLVWLGARFLQSKNHRMPFVIERQSWPR